MKRLDKIYEKAKRLTIDDKTKLVIMSDCHRGAGNNEDNFGKNQNIYDSALQYYFDEGFTYIELGDGDEMWEVKKYNEIIEEHIDSFKKIKKFHEQGRFIMLYGNHDMAKKSQNILKKYFYEYDDKVTNKKEALLMNLEAIEALVLGYKGHDIFLLHGHQVDFLNNNLWPVARFLVRHVWSKLELIGIKDPTSAAKNYMVMSKVEKTLQNWSKDNNKIIIVGHTHRPVFPNIKESLYFNDGSCVHPNGITAIEIKEGKITLVKWGLDVLEEQIIVKRFVLDGSENIEDFFLD